MDGHNNEEIKAPLLTTVEDMIEQSIGRVTFTQIVQAILVTFFMFFDSQQTFISIFAQDNPPWHCTGTGYCNSGSDVCSLNRSAWEWDSKDVYTSVISEWDLQCASSFLTGLPSTMYFGGCFLGGLALATVGDSSLGRKKLLVFSTLIMYLAALASTFSPNIWIYSGLRFLSGIGRSPVAICCLVLLSERVGKRRRSEIVLIGFTQFSVGLLALTGIAYLTRFCSWRILYLCTSIPGILWSILCYFFLYESPRWLFMQGREVDAMDVLKKLASTTQNALSSPTKFTPQMPQNTTNLLASLNLLFARKWAVKRLMASVFLSFGIGLMFFGMFLGVENLGYDIYLTCVFNALLSISTYLLTFMFWIQRCNRRSSLFGFCTLSGLTCIIFSTINIRNEGLLIVLELVALFCSCMAYNIVMMYVVELFPTCVRSSASSLVRQAMILGSVFDPILVMLGRSKLVYSYGVFGFAMLFSGFMVVFLPETNGKVLCDTMEEQELRDNHG